MLDLQVGEIGDQLAQKCTVGDVAIQGGSFVAIPAQYSTSRLHYHLRLKGPLGLQVRVQKLPQHLGRGSQQCIRWCRCMRLVR